MPGEPHVHLTRRERQIMDVVYAQGRVTVSEVQEGLPDAPSYSAVRAMLRKLEEKGHVRHDASGPRYVYEATLPRERAKRSALDRLIRTFFDGSPSRTVAAVLDLRSTELSEAELEAMADMIEVARKRGR
jgi:BlaI family transcriptional regulator, penicillinase repressor